MSWYFKFENLKYVISSNHMYPLLSSFMNRIGYISVDNSQTKNDLVGAIIHEINKKEKISVVIRASGKMSKSSNWKSDLYHIAIKANIPILCYYIDYKTKTFGLISENNSVIQIKEEDNIVKKNI